MKPEVCPICKAAISAERGAGVPPSHLTIPQVAFVLGVTRQAVWDRVFRGTLPTEIWHQTKMIPTWAVMKALNRRKP